MPWQEEFEGRFETKPIENDDVTIITWLTLTHKDALKRLHFKNLRLRKKTKLYKIDHRQATRVTLLCVSAGPLDGNWGSWTPWTRCSQTCGISGGTTLRRTRLCNQPPPMNGGKHCVGNDTETTRSCFTPCPGLVIIETKMIYACSAALPHWLIRDRTSVNSNENQYSLRRHFVAGVIFLFSSLFHWTN